MKKNTRRSFLGLLSAAGVGWLAAGLYPVFRYLSPQQAPDPFGKDGLAAVEKITLADVAKPNMGKNGGYGGRGLIVFRNAQGELKAFDSKCTHAGCNVEFEATKIYCHCHGGTYNLDGKNIAGPPPRPLTELGVLEKDDALFVYRLGGARPAQA